MHDLFEPELSDITITVVNNGYKVLYEFTNRGDVNRVYTEPDNLVKEIISALGLEMKEVE